MRAQASNRNLHLLRFAALIVLAVGASACSTANEPETDAEVLAFWITEASSGDVESAGSVLADDVDWIGLGNSPESYARGAQAYDVTDLQVTCEDTPPIPQCDATWTDKWTDQIPSLDRAELRVSAEIRDGKIVAFREWFFGLDTRDTYVAHGSWLEMTDPQSLQSACSEDPADLPCSQLFVDTASDFANSS